MFDGLKRFHSNPHEIAALEYLNHPSDFSGLRNMDVRDIEFQLVKIPSFEPYCTWTLFTPKDGNAVVRRIMWQRTAPHELAIEGPTTFGADGFIDRATAAEIVTSLGSIAIPAFGFPPTLGIDGTTFGVRKTDNFHRAELFWWSRPPSGWERLASWLDETISVFDSALPKPTAKQ
jgi:hypothetical protein